MNSLNIHNSKDVPETMEFEEIRSMFHTNVDEKSLDIYLLELYKEISTIENSKRLGISKSTYAKYLKDSPIFITEKIFNSFTKKNSNYLSYDQFSTPLKQLMFGNYKEVVRIIFNIYDFDKSGKINTKDIKLLLSYIPLKEEVTKKDYMYQMESLEELDEIINLTFGLKESNIDPDEFNSLVDKKANVFLLLLCYLYMIFPIFKESLSLYELKTKSSEGLPMEISSDCEKSDDSTKEIKEGKNLYIVPSCFSPLHQLRELHRQKKTYDMKAIALESPKRARKSITHKADAAIEKELAGVYSDAFDVDNKSRAANKPKTLNAKEYEKKVSVELKELHDSMLSLNVDDLPKCEKDDAKKLMNSLTSEKKVTFSLKDELMRYRKDCNSDEVFNKSKINIFFEGELFKLSSKEKDKKAPLKSFFLVLINSNIYYYNSKNYTIENYKKTRYLNGCFILNNKEETINGDIYYSFSIKFAQKSMINKQYYSKDKHAINDWIKFLRLSTNYRDLFDYYNMTDDIDKGQFGKITLGKNIKTGDEVAIKIIQKLSKNFKRDHENILKQEIDIMKLSRHPNIVTYIDDFENSKYIFIVMEYMKYGTLQNHLESKKYALNEGLIARISYQIADALQYLHKYGVIHRDLKPQNIMITSKTEDIRQFNVKITDFGMGKIISSEEKAVEGCGTLAYQAPEVLLGIPYNTSVDIWSLGVIIYHMFSGEFPFQGKKKEDYEISVINDKANFTSKFNKVSPEAIDLISKCLEKDYNKRIKVDEIFQHDFFLKNSYYL